MAKHIKTDGSITIVEPDEGESFSLDKLKELVGGMKRLLLVDDHDGIRRAFLRQLRNYDVEVLVAADFDKAVGMVKLCPDLDIVLTDWDLDELYPARTGLDLLSLVVPDTTHQVLMSGAHPSEMDQEMLKANVDLFLSKPFSLFEVADALGIREATGE